MTRVLIIGFGFMGRKHAEVYATLPGAEVVGLVDSRLDAASLPVTSWGEIPVFRDFASAAAAVDFSVADICLPTDLHGDVAREAFAAGKHVFCEKPIALKTDEASAMIDAARQAGRQFMVGHCIRFWPEYVELKRLVDSGEHGRLLSLVMSRRSGRPAYTAGDWVNKPERCLGAALDLHIHDADFLLHLLGSPETVVSRGLRDETGWSSITTQYGYPGRAITAEGAWNYPEKWGFQMRFSAVFERAALDYDSRDGLMLAVGNAAPVGVAVPPQDGYHHELAYFIACLERGEPVAISNGGQALASLELVLTEIESAASGHLIFLTK